jgi:hypothetical protein
MHPVTWSCIQQLRYFHTGIWTIAATDALTTDSLIAAYHNFASTEAKDNTQAGPSRLGPPRICLVHLVREQQVLPP